MVVFAIYPLALAIFREANISRKLIPGCIALGAFTFTMTAIPGTQIQNLIPMKYFGTTPSAAPIMPGIAGALVMFVLDVLYMEWRKRSARRKAMSLQSPMRSMPRPGLKALTSPMWHWPSFP